MRTPIPSTRSIVSTKLLLGLATASLLMALPSAHGQSTWDGGAGSGR
jgi:hypothetical protein